MVVRLFFCLEFSEELKGALGELARDVRRALGTGTWVPPENYHLTVRFLGEVPEEKVPALLHLGKSAAQEARPFTLRLETLGSFPQARASRVLWVGPRAEPQEFQDLCRRVEEGLQALGFPKEKKEPRPHVTLARFKSPQDLRAVLARPLPPLPEVSLLGLTLMRSELRPQGAKYTPLAVWKLGG